MTQIIPLPLFLLNLESEMKGEKLQKIEYLELFR